MRRVWNPRTMSLTIVVLMIGAVSAVAAPQNMIHGRPAFDSGWREIGGNPLLQITHNLGGDVDDYVVDVQLHDGAGAGSEGVTIRGFGGDRYGTADDDKKGIEVQEIDSSDVWLSRGTAETSLDLVRVRIWLVPNPQYDSGWEMLEQDTGLVLSHYLGGDVDDYVVDLTMRNGATVHKRGLGGDRYAASATEKGVYWYSLSDTDITVWRCADDTDSTKVRLRIFVRPDPDYDSDWINLAPGTGVELLHDLGGPWNDLSVDLQLKETTPHGHVTHCHGFSGDQDRDSATDLGAYWWGLTGSRINLWRNADDTAADLVRVRIWASRAPSYDSGWVVMPEGPQDLIHNLGGDPDAYVVDLQLRDTDESHQAGVNARGYGGDVWYDFGDAEHRAIGAFWYGLDSSSISLFSRNGDAAADHARLRLWHAAPPDYDSGWQALDPGESLEFTHGLDTNPFSLVVDLQYRPSSTEPSHSAYGIDEYLDTNLMMYAQHGAVWRALTSSTVKVKRFAQDSVAEEVRVRIWRNSAWDKAEDNLFPDAGRNNWYHRLGVDADELVVYQWAHNDQAFWGHNGYRFGGDTTNMGGSSYGFWWEELTSSYLALYRGLNDGLAETIFARLWWTGPDTLFADGFETGDTLTWSITVP